MTHRDSPGGVTFWATMVLGAGIVGFGVRGVLTHLRPTRIVNLSLFFGASGVVHDALWAPALVAAALVTRWLPTPMRRPVRVALAASATLTLFAIPVLAGPSTAVRNPTVGPLDYARNLTLVVGGFWLLAALAVVHSYWMTRTGRRR